MEWINVETSRSQDLTQISRGTVARHVWRGGAVYHVRSQSHARAGHGFLRNHVICWTRAGRRDSSIAFFPAMREWFVGPSEDHYEHVAVEFTQQFFQDNGLLTSCAATPRPFATSSDALTFELIRAIFAEAQAGGESGSLYAQCLGVALASRILKTCEIDCSSQLRLGLTPAARKRVIDYIQAHLHRDLSLSTLAQVADTDVRRFVQMFKDSMGHSPHQYVLRARIDRAKMLLKDDDIPLGEVALGVGFADQSHFTKTFRRLAGVPPNAYRQMAR